MPLELCAAGAAAGRARGPLNPTLNPRAAQIHALLEADFVPLELCARLAPLLDALEGLNRPLSSASPVPDAMLGQYKRALQQVQFPGQALGAEHLSYR